VRAELEQQPFVRKAGLGSVRSSYGGFVSQCIDIFHIGYGERCHPLNVGTVGISFDLHAQFNIDLQASTIRVKFLL
jgi:hypothetical protein